MRWSTDKTNGTESRANEKLESNNNNVIKDL